jgi:hypothetical protein
MAQPREYSPIVFTDEVDRRELARAEKAGRLVRLAPGVYTSLTAEEPATVVRKHLWQILAHELPGAVIGDRSARTGGMPADGRLYVVARRTRPLELPGVLVVPRSGPGALPGDMALPDGLHIMGEARTLLDNLARSRLDRTGRSRTLTRDELETWLDALCAARGETGMNKLRDQARELAPALGRDAEFQLLDRLIGTALNTRDDVRLTSVALASRAAGRPVDSTRLDAFARLAKTLADTPPQVIAALPEDEPRRVLLPFYEAYFSNFIEGTEFTLDEAAEIVFDHNVPDQRPADAHDVLATFRIANDPVEMRRVPRNGDELIQLLQTRHAVLMDARPDKHPGRWKQKANRAGSTYFVDPELVEGTLAEGFDLGAALTSPFARAVFLMFLVSEVHPFTDGNGRIARLMMNAELVTAAEVRIIIPTVYRLNYLSALQAATRTGNDQALIATLSFARRWTARVNFSTRSSTEADLVATNALRDARDAENAGIGLKPP